MNVAIYGEIANDYFIKGDRVSYRMGGAGYYASVAALHQGANVDFLTIYNSKLDKYFQGSCSEMGINMSMALDDESYMLPQYLCKGYEGNENKRSFPLMFDAYPSDYVPKLPQECDTLLIFPIFNEIPRQLIERAHDSKIPVLLDPKPNRNGIQKTEDILQYVDCLLVNDEELKLLADEISEEKSIQSLREKGVRSIIVKHGIKGCSIYQEQKEPVHQKAYHSEAVCKLGSGDVFAGCVAAEFSTKTDIMSIVDKAQCVAAHFIEHLKVSSILRADEVLLEQKKRRRISKNLGKKVYLSAPFFSLSECLLEEKVYTMLYSKGFEVYSPLRENGVLNEESSYKKRKDVFQTELDEIENSDFVVAILDGNDMGTAFELGYAYQKGKKIFGLYTDKAPLNNMLQIGCYRINGSIEELCKDIEG